MKFVILQVKGNILFQSNGKVSVCVKSFLHRKRHNSGRREKVKKKGNIFTVAKLLYWCQIEVEYRAVGVSLCQ